MAAIDRRLRGVHTAIPGTIVSYDATTQRAVIKPAVEIESAVGGEFIALPNISNVPVVWPRGSGGGGHCPLVQGDGVLLIFPEQDPGAWLASVGSQPQTHRRHGLSSPFAIPGATPDANPLPTSAASSSAASWTGPTGAVGVHATATGVALGTLAASDPVVLQSLLQTAIQTAATAAVGAAVPNDGGKVALQTFASTFATQLIGALKVTAE
jgi:hypothetical protein